MSDAGKIAPEAIFLAIIFIRTLVLYLAILVSMRFMGKRQLGELEISEFIVAALIADLAATPLQDIGIPLLNGLIPILTLLCLEILISGLSMRSIKVRKLVFGKPSVIICHGRINRSEMLNNRFTLDELMQELRTQSISDINDVEYAILETSGQLNVILTQSAQPVTPKLLGIDAGTGDYPHILISEGRILDNNLELLKKDRQWLKKELKKQKIKSHEDVYIFTCSDNGSIYCQTKGENVCAKK